MKLLYLLNVYPRIGPFCLASIKAAKSLGIQTHLAGNWGYADERARQADQERYGVSIHQVDFCRNPLHPGNLRAYRQLLQLQEREGFDAIHCNTPVAGLIGRILGHKARISPVIYQAHGFHFFDGAPILNWLLYYPMEKWMARLTDLLVVINREDLDLACRKLPARGGRKPVYVHGVGVDMERFAPNGSQRGEIRRQLGLQDRQPVVISVGELNNNKNHATLLNAVANLPGYVLLLAGKGPREEDLRSLADRLGIADRVHFLGFRKDLDVLYTACDVFCLTSFREGLSTAIMEAMASGLPVVVSDIRGNRDLVNPRGGRLVKPDDAEGFALALKQVLEDGQAAKDMGRFNREAVQAFSLPQVVKEWQGIYGEMLPALKKEAE